MFPKTLHILWKILKIFLCYVIICTLLTPLLRPKSTGNEDAANILSAKATGERVRCIDDNEEALVRRLQMIHSARSEIILSTFDFHIDNSGKQVLAALNDAAERGVKVKIIVDGVSEFLRLRNNEYFRSFAMNKNVEVKAYSRINLLMPWRLNYRLHDKYLIADDVYVVGGRNTYDLFLGKYTKHRNEDRDILVYGGDANMESSGTEGSAATAPAEGTSEAELKSYFAKMWKCRDCSRYRWKTTEANRKKAQRELQKIAARQYDVFLELRQQPDWENLTIPTSSITLLVNPKKAFISEPTVWNNLCKYMSKGDDVVIQTPYIIFSNEMYRDFAKVCRSADKVNIITNAVESGANPFGCTDYLNNKEKILKCGTGVCEYIGSHSMHTKTVLIDDDTSIVGSFNMDERSAYLDTEMMMVIKGCPELNAKLRNECSVMKTKSIQVAPDGTETRGTNYHPRSMVEKKKIRYAVLRVLVIPFRYLL